jgi:catechol 2,3-dioxygenase-like lactoylglutathione lyase family enzyme
MPHVHHSAICTADLDEALRFWRDGLGLSTFFDREFNGDWPTLFGATTDRLRSVFLGDGTRPDSGIVELVVFDGVDTSAQAAEEPAAGFFLLSFEVGDVAGTLARLAELGYRDGDGVLVELIGPAA